MSSIVPSLRSSAPLGVLLVGLMWAPGLRAQPAPAPVCDGALASAGQRYVERAYDAVEALVLECVSRPEAAPADLVRAHRLLALSFIKRDLMVEAQGAVVKLLSVDYGYEPDRLLDLPLYVALVDVVKDQLSVAAPVERSVAVATSAPSRADVPSGIDINTASAELLDTVPGIGPALAGRILAFREQNGPFRSVGDLERVRGIGPRSLERMAPYLTANRPTRWVSSAGGGVSSVRLPDGPSPVPSGPRVNLNTATVEELDTLDGIGPALAGRIVEYRASHGPFRSVSDVLQVRGIGPRTLEGFADQVTVE